MQRVSAYAQSVRDTRPLDPASAVRVPFDRSIVERARRLATDALEVPQAVVEALRRITAEARAG